jgi:multidrug efflux system membrane fusion protein
MVTKQKSKFHSKGTRAALAVIALAIVAAGAASLWHQRPATAARGSAPVALPVQVANAARRDVPIYATGIGSVQASFTIGVHAQVDGQLDKVLFTEGQDVRQGDVLAKISPNIYQAALDQAKARKGQDEAQLVSAQKDLVRFNALGDFSTQQSKDQQLAKVDQLKASIAADQASIESAQTQLNYTDIVAPSDGRIGIRQVDPGNIVHTNDQTPIAILTRTHPIAVIFTLPSRYLDDVRAALNAGPVEVTAFDQNNKRALSTGTLQLVDNIIDQTTSSIKLKAQFDNSDDALWPGEFVNARILLQTQHNAMTVPTAAIQRNQEGLYVWAVDKDDRVTMRKVAVGAAQGDVTIVQSGLDEGAEVVTDGQYRLQQNAHVTVNTSATPASAS